MRDVFGRDSPRLVLTEPCLVAEPADEGFGLVFRSHLELVPNYPLTSHLALRPHTVRKQLREEVLSRQNMQTTLQFYTTKALTKKKWAF